MLFVHRITNIPLDEPQTRESASASVSFVDILGSHQITSASPSGPKRSHTINIPFAASLKRSSTTAASFIRSRGGRFTKSVHPGELPHNGGNDSQRPPHVINHRRIASASMTIRRSATSATAYIRGKMKPSVGGDPQLPTRMAGGEHEVVMPKPEPQGTVNE